MSPVGEQVEPGVFELPEPTHASTLIRKGYTPHVLDSNGPLVGTRREIWWDRGNTFEWPMAATLIAAMIFVVLLVQGVPW